MKNKGMGWLFAAAAAVVALAGCDDADTVTNLGKYRDQVNKSVAQQTAFLNRLNTFKAQRDKEQAALKAMQGPEVGKDLAQMGPDLEKTTNGKVSTNDKLPNGAERLVIAGTGAPTTSVQAFHNVAISAPGVVLVEANFNANTWSFELQEPPPSPPPPIPPAAPQPDGGLAGLPPMPEAKGMMGLPPGSKTKDLVAEISTSEEKLRNLTTATGELPQVQADKAKIDQQLRDLSAPNRTKNAMQLVEVVMNGNPPLLTDAKITMTNDGQSEIRGDLGPGHQLAEISQRVGIQWDVVSSEPSGKTGVDVRLRKKGAIAGIPSPPRPIVQPPVQPQPTAHQAPIKQPPPVRPPPPSHPPPPAHSNGHPPPPSRPPPPGHRPTSGH